MSDLPVKAENQLADESEKRRIVRLLKEKSVSYLSPEKETGPFLLYSIGNSLDEIAMKTNLPKDVILCTALQYNWDEKVKYLQRESLDPVHIQRDIANTVLVATFTSVMRDLGDVIAGKKSAKEVSLIPKNLTALQNLMDLVTSLNAPKVEQGSTTNIIHATNVQVNQKIEDGNSKKDPWDVEVSETRKEMLKALEE